MKINEIVVDLNQLTELEIVHILLRIGMRPAILQNIFFKKKNSGFGIIKLKRYSKAVAGHGGASGRLPDELFNHSSHYWHARRKIHAAVFFKYWENARLELDFWQAFVASYTRYMDSVDDVMIDANRAFHLTQQQLELVPCGKCGRKLLRATWEVRNRCPVCRGDLKRSLNHHKKLKLKEETYWRREELFLEGIHA